MWIGALSRDRYWGTPLPVWVSDDDPERVEWIGSIAELAERAGGLPDGFDPHRPFIDEVTWRCPETGSTMRRTPEVLDVWFDSGAMPWAQWHYPFENRKLFERHYPADFICEAVRPDARVVLLATRHRHDARHRPGLPGA